MTEPDAPGDATVEAHPTRSSWPDTVAIAHPVGIDPAAAPVLMSVGESGTVLHASAGADSLFGTAKRFADPPEIIGRSLFDFIAPDEHGVLHSLLSGDCRAPGSGGPVSFDTLFTGQRDDGLPLALRLVVPAAVATGHHGNEPGPGPVPGSVAGTGERLLMFERWGGPVTWAGEPSPPDPARTGPDHVLSHDVRGAIRNARNFAGIFARRLRPENPEAEPLLGPDGKPLSLDLLDIALRSAAGADETLEQIVRFMRLEHDPIPVQRIGLPMLIEQGRLAAQSVEDDLAEIIPMPELSAPVPINIIARQTNNTGGTGPIDPAGIFVVVNLDLLGWCIGELLVNARKFAGPTTVVTLAATMDGAWVHLDVTSTGKTIDPTLAEDAFKLGRMLQPRGDQPGVGMGLAICRRIITRHGGRIIASIPSDTATDPIGTGANPVNATTFALRLPGVAPEIVG